MENKSNIEEILKEGYAHLGNGEINEAIETYLRGLKDNPDNISLVNNLAQTYAMVGDKRSSRHYHLKLIEIIGSDSSQEMLMLKANSLLSINNLTEALEVFEKVISKNPQNTQALFQISSIYSEKEEYSKSNRYLNMILDYDPDNVLALIRKGVNYLNEENYDNALLYYDRALEISPRHERVIRLKGELLKQIGDGDQLDAHIRKTLKVKPDSPYTLMLKAMQCANEDKEKKAIDLFNRAIAIDPEFDEAYFNKAGFLMLKKRFDEAIDCYRQAFEINPESGGIVDKEGLFELLNQMKNAG